MTHSHLVLAASVGWAAIAVLLFVAVGTMSLLSVALLAVGGLGPPIVYAALSRGPTRTMAEVLQDVDQGRPGQ